MRNTVENVFCGFLTQFLHWSKLKDLQIIKVENKIIYNFYCNHEFTENVISEKVIDLDYCNFSVQKITLTLTFRIIFEKIVIE
jgi:hypothetical protein